MPATAASDIREVTSSFPSARETKVDKLLTGLGVLWRQNPQEKVVVFATYLGTVDLISRQIDAMFPGQGVAVLRGGDHGAKVAAERRFRQKDGPRVLVCTAAGREGINLQFARVLFNFDLPWNPMDMRDLVDLHYPSAATIRVVLDNLSTHSAGAGVSPAHPIRCRLRPRDLPSP